VDLPNSAQNLILSHCWNCNFLISVAPNTTILHNRDYLSEYITCMQRFSLGLKKNEHSTILWLHVSIVVHHYEANPQNYWLYYAEWKEHLREGVGSLSHVTHQTEISRPLLCGFWCILETAQLTTMAKVMHGLLKPLEDWPCLHHYRSLK
jgi:hypothetical protein